MLKVPFLPSVTGAGGLTSLALSLYDAPGPDEATEGTRDVVTAHAKGIIAVSDVVIVVLDFTILTSMAELSILE